MPLAKWLHCLCFGVHPFSPVCGRGPAIMAAKEGSKVCAIGALSAERLSQVLGSGLPHFGPRCLRAASPSD
jgi:hypothetical protein